MTIPTLALVLALAQAPAPPVKDADKAAQMSEDVEVMRRLLNKALGVPNEAVMADNWTEMYYDLGASLVTPNGANASGWLVNPPVTNNPADLLRSYNSRYTTLRRVRVADPFDGVYLGGHGVVYTLRVRSGEQYSVGETKRAAHLATTCTLCHAVDPATAAKLQPSGTAAELSDWDKARNEVRGQKLPAAPTTPPTVEANALCRPGTLTEAVIDVLGKNGRHLRHLPGTESVTVVVTLDGLYGPARSLADGQPAKVVGFTPDESKLIAVGDLHAKNGKAKEAAAAYAKALARFPNAEIQFPLAWVPTAANADKFREEARQAFADVRRKLAVAVLGNADDPMAIEAGAKAVALAANTKVTFLADAPAMTVPAKVVVTVKKQDLDSAVFLQPENYRKTVSVTTTGFPPADKKK